MKKKMITFAALAIGAIGVTTAFSGAEASMVSAGHKMKSAGSASLVTKASFRHKAAKRHQRRVVRHKIHRHKKWQHKNWKRRQAWKRNRNWRTHLRLRSYYPYGYGLIGVNLGYRAVCNQFYSKAVNTGSRYWWGKYNNCVRSYYYY